MELSQVVQIAVSGSGSHDVTVSTLEPADIPTEIVGNLSQIISELVRNAAAFSSPDQQVSVGGEFNGGDYLISITDEGVGVPDLMLAALNKVLAGPGGEGPNQGIALVARLAARSGIEVQLTPGEPGTTARVHIPRNLVEGESPFMKEPETPTPESEERNPDSVDLTSLERYSAARKGHVVSVVESSGVDVEAFLETIFGPLRGKVQRRDRPDRESGASNGGPSRDRERIVPTRPLAEHELIRSGPTLRVRVPGENFSVVEDEPSTASSEAAIDIKSALAKYESGRSEARRGRD